MYFERERIHKGVWKAPKMENVNQIDHILISQRQALLIIDVKTCREPIYDFDHYLVKTVFREWLSSNVLKSEREPGN